jgi:hypothetical protein
VSPNGYHYTRVKGTWRLTHHIVAEGFLGRKLRDGERVRFKTSNRMNLSPSNIEVVEKGKGSLRRRKAALEARIEELQAQLADINDQLKKSSGL